MQTSNQAAVIKADNSDENRRTRITELNDAFRQGRGSGKTMITQGIEAQGPEFVVRAHLAVCGFDDFSPDNDPHGEHDFGSFEIDGIKCFWKIDYYDRALEYGSEDPANPLITTRVLTIMLASEY